MSEDKKLWQDAMQGVMPLTPDNKIKIKTPKIIPRKINPIEREKISTLEFYDNDIEQPEHIFFARSGLQYRVQHQLRCGKIRPEATLDLHGFTIEEARTAVGQFLLKAQQHHVRALKIIHGKSTAILRNKVYQWLPQSPQILAVCSTIASDGGTGAVYVLLRNHLNPR
ncbi:MAG: Smr/MutS family protein [Legionellales bacterium]|jgi:DNA-nicking Smr family endonuclease